MTYRNVAHPFRDGSYIAGPASSQSHKCLVKIAVEGDRDSSSSEGQIDPKIELIDASGKSHRIESMENSFIPQFFARCI